MPATLSSLGAIGDAIRSYVQARATEIAAEQIARIPAHESTVRELIWKTPDDGTVHARIEGATHKLLPELIAEYQCGERNFYVCGPAGSGKTTLARQLAKTLGHEFGTISCTAGMSEGAVVGRMIPNLTTGTVDYQGTPFVRCYQVASVFLFDEGDAADANMLLAINSATANGHMTLPDGREIARHEDAVIILAANTYGTGADRMYVGRTQLDAAFLDRFAFFECDYDRDLEGKLVGDAQICARIWAMREKIAALKLRRVFGTRSLMRVARRVKVGGKAIDAALSAEVRGWTADERSKVGIGG